MLQYLDDWLILASSHLEALGEGQGVANVQSSQNCHQPREIVVSPIPDDGLFGDGSGQPVFEGLSDSQADRNRSRADHRISVLQAAKRGLLGRLTSLCHLFPGGGGGGGSSPSSISTVMPSQVLGFCRRVCLSGVDRHGSFRSAMVVGRSEHSSRGVSRYTLWTITFGPTRWTRVGVPMSAITSFPAGGLRKRSKCPSTFGNCWLFVSAFNISIVFWRGRRSGCLPTTPQRLRMSGNREGLTHIS